MPISTGRLEDYLQDFQKRWIRDLVVRHHRLSLQTSLPPFLIRLLPSLFHRIELKSSENTLKYSHRQSRAA